MNNLKGLGIGIGAACIFAVSSQGEIIFSFEGAGVQATTVSGAVTETFDNINPGTYASYSSPTIGGTYTPLMVTSANVYGGAGGTLSFADLNGSPVQTTLTFTGSKTYFGMWWSAGDWTDRLQFYSGSTMVGSFVVGDLIPYLAAGYYGNPNGNMAGNTGEPYAYVNFTGVAGTTFDKIVLTESAGGGFESDNHSIFDQPINPPGTVVPGNDVPETSRVVSLAVLLFPVIATAVRRWRRR